MTQLPQSDRSPLPLVDEESAPHWEALERGVLVLRRCEVCRALSHPLVRECRACEGPHLAWEEVGTRVRLYSWAVETRAVIQGMNPPYVIAQVTPEECEDGDVRLVGTLLSDPAELEFGMPLVLRTAVVPGSDKHIATYVQA